MILYYYNIMPKKIVKQIDLTNDTSKDNNTVLAKEDKPPAKTKTIKKKVSKLETHDNKALEITVNEAIETTVNEAIKTTVNEAIEIPVNDVQKKVTKTRTSKKNDKIVPPVKKEKVTKASKKIVDDNLEQSTDTLKVTKQKNTKKVVSKNVDKTELDKSDNLDKPNEYLDNDPLNKSYDDVNSDESSEIAQKFLEFKNKWELTHQEIYEHNIKGEQLEFLRRYYISQMSEILENNNFKKHKTNIIDTIIESENNTNNNESLDDSVADLSDDESYESENDKTLNLKIKNKIIKKPVTSSDSDSD